MEFRHGDSFCNDFFEIGYMHKLINVCIYISRFLVIIWKLHISTNSLIFYSDSSDDYKLLRIVSGSAAYIYFQRLDSWKKIEFLENNDYICSLWSLATFFGQSFYFTAQKYVICFDVNTEKFKVMQFPPIPSGSLYFCESLVILDGCICLHVAYKIERNSRLEADLWRIDGDGDKWVKVTDLPSDQLPSGKICITTNKNTPAILEDNNSFSKFNMEDLTSSDYWNLNIYQRTIYA